MGSGRWDNTSYYAGISFRAASGTPDFEYDVKVKTGEATTVHPDLDPKWVAGVGSPLAGRPVRESRDSAEHPETVPVAVFFDVTGSMGKIPLMLQKKLASLMDVIMGKAGLAHPQILMGAIGDATCDRFPLQIGQFESDNRLDEQLRKIILEGGGGGQVMESYGLAYLYAARHMMTDAWDKRGRKGYLFTIGDEMPHQVTDAAQISRLFGSPEASDEATKNVVSEAQERWMCYHIHANDGSYPGRADIIASWKGLLGQENLIIVEDSSVVCEVIAGIIHSCETASGLDSAIDAVGVSGRDALVVRSALANFAAIARPGTGGPPLPAAYGR